MLTDELLTYIFNGQSHLLVQPMATWLASSRRFVAFVATFRDKIRKKVRVTQDEESLLDLQLELETAYLLLQERPLNLVYEPQPSGKLRGPDFAVTYTTSFTFMVEVTRLRPDQKNARPEAQAAAPAPDTALPIPPSGERVADAVCSKLGQLRPQHSNVLVVGLGHLFLTPDDLRMAMVRIQQRAERNDAAFWQRHRFRDRADFFNHYQRLSEVLVRGPHLSAATPTAVWVNSQAKHPLPGKVRTAVYRSHAL